MRLFITTLSMFCVISFGYALAGYGGGVLSGNYRADYITLGLLLGFAFGGSAMWLWNKHKAEFFTDAPDDMQPDMQPAAPDWTLGLPEKDNAE